MSLFLFGFMPLLVVIDGEIALQVSATCPICKEDIPTGGI
jgi:hypothetical protein